MSSPFVAEIRMFSFNFAPTGWAQCNGQLMPISQNTALFSLLGTYYGGNGQSTFGLPDLQGSAPIHHGQGPGLSEYFIGQSGGSDSVTLLESEIPAHSHSVGAQSIPLGGTTQPSATSTLNRPASGNLYTASGPTAPMAFQTIAAAGGSLPHNNMMRYLTLNFCIALQGVFPPRSLSAKGKE